MNLSLIALSWWKAIQEDAALPVDEEFRQNSVAQNEIQTINWQWRRNGKINSRPELIFKQPPPQSL